MTPRGPQSDWPAWHPPTCLCGHTAAEHGRASSTVLTLVQGQCSKCACEKYEERQP